MANEPRCPSCNAILPIPPGSQLQVTCPGCGRFVGAGGAGAATGPRTLLLVVGAALALIGGGAGFAFQRGAERERQEAQVRQEREAKLKAKMIEEEALLLKAREEQAQARALAAAAQSAEAPQPPPVPPPAPAAPTSSRPFGKLGFPGVSQPGSDSAKTLPMVVKAQALGVSGGPSAATVVRVMEGSSGLLARCFTDARASCSGCSNGFAGVATVYAGADGKVFRVEPQLGHTAGGVNPAASKAADRFNACLAKDLLALRFAKGAAPVRVIYRLEVGARE